MLVLDESLGCSASCLTKLGCSASYLPNITTPVSRVLGKLKVVSYRPPTAISQEEVQAEKDRMKAIDARPIKKVAEAKARKQKRMAVSMLTSTTLSPPPRHPLQAGVQPAHCLYPLIATFYHEL